jgi:hypothetical protein
VPKFRNENKHLVTVRVQAGEEVEATGVLADRLDVIGGVRNLTTDPEEQASGNGDEDAAGSSAPDPDGEGAARDGQQPPGGDKPAGGTLTTASVPRKK